jgi:hypothetical protein
MREIKPTPKGRPFIMRFSGGGRQAPPDLVGNSLCREQEKRTMRETEVQIGDSNSKTDETGPSERKK